MKNIFRIKLMKIFSHEKIPVLVLLFLFTAICVSSSIFKSPAYDEIQHLSSGYASLKTGNFSIGLGHPPLYRILIAFPLLLINPDFDREHILLKKTQGSDPKTWSVLNDYYFGYDFFYNSGNNHKLMFFLGRFISIILGVLLGCLVYRFSKDLFNRETGLFSLFIYVFSPTIIANSRLTVNDIASTLTMLFAIYSYYRYSIEKNNRDFLVLCLAVSAAMVTKFNSVILLPLVMIGLIYTDGIKKGLFRYLFLLCAVLCVINIIYGFDGTFKLKELDQDAFGRMIPFDFMEGILYRIYSYLPLPEFYLKSFIRLLMHNVKGHSTYLAGNYSVHGWWYFFIVSFLIKTPLMILCATVFWFVRFFKKFKLSKGEIFLCIFFVVYFILSLRSRINIGHRHILPVYPVLFILLGGVYIEYRKIPLRKSIRILLVTSYILSTQIYFPHYLSYFNALVRPQNGYKYLLDSNLDWGQDLLMMKKFLKRHNDPSLIFSYFGSASRNAYGIGYQDLLSIGKVKIEQDRINPYDVKKEFLAVSATNMKSVYYVQKDIFSWIEDMTPIGKAGYSIFIYDISDDVRATAIIGEIYRSMKKDTYAARQYKRVIHLTKKEKIIHWARSRLALLKEKNEE